MNLNWGFEMKELWGWNLVTLFYSRFTLGFMCIWDAFPKISKKTSDLLLQKYIWFIFRRVQVWNLTWQQKINKPLTSISQMVFYFLPMVLPKDWDFRKFWRIKFDSYWPQNLNRFYLEFRLKINGLIYQHSPTSR